MIHAKVAKSVLDGQTKKDHEALKENAARDAAAARDLQQVQEEKMKELARLLELGKTARHDLERQLTQSTNEHANQQRLIEQHERRAADEVQTIGMSENQPVLTKCF